MYLVGRKGNPMRTYLNTLLHRKRGGYGPLWIFELDPETWAIVWSGWLEDENTCRLILSEDPEWFNCDWSMDGRRPNPTYKTHRKALEEVIRLLRTMKTDLEHSDAEQRKFGVYISDAEHDLHRVLTSKQGAEPDTSQTKVHAPESAFVAPEGAGVAQARESAHPPVRVEKTPPALATQADEPKAKPWENSTDAPRGLNFQPDATLHAKMNWVCENVPKMSRLRILREGAELLCNQLIAENYREDE
jgi:hypothetical protein